MTPKDFASKLISLVWIGSESHSIMTTLYRSGLYEGLILAVDGHVKDYLESLCANFTPESRKKLVAEIQDFAECIRQAQQI